MQNCGWSVNDYLAGGYVEVKHSQFMILFCIVRFSVVNDISGLTATLLFLVDFYKQVISFYLVSYVDSNVLHNSRCCS